MFFASLVLQDIDKLTYCLSHFLDYENPQLQDTNDLPDVHMFPDQVPMETAPVQILDPTIPMDTVDHHAEEQLLETSSEEEDERYDDVTGNSSLELFLLSCLHIIRFNQGFSCFIHSKANINL